MSQIISVDLDGTLLSSDNKVTEYTKEIIKLLIDQGFYFILASGRHYIDVIKIQNALQIKSFMITSNGSRVYDLNRKVIFNDNLNPDIALKLCRIKYLDQDIITQVYRDDQWYTNSNDKDNKFCSTFSSLKYQYFHPDYFNFSNISKIFFTSSNFKKLYNLQETINNFLSDQVNTSFSMPGCLEVISGKTSKGFGLKIISNFLGISLKKFISFGDGMNDQDMLRISGKSYIMENADLALKKKFPDLEVIRSNNNDGVARCLKKYLCR